MTTEERPPLPHSIDTIILQQEDVQSVLERYCDASIDADTWSNATVADNNFGYDLTGDNTVYQFATQGCGSIFGLRIGNDPLNRLSPERLDNDYHVVHVSSEGSTAVVASNLREFYSLALTLNIFLDDVIERASGCSSSERGLYDALRAKSKSLLQGFRHQELEESPEETQAMLASIVTVAQQLGVELMDDESAVDKIFSLQDIDFRPSTIQ